MIVATQLEADCTVSQEVRDVAFDACVLSGHRVSGSGRHLDIWTVDAKAGKRWFKLVGCGNKTFICVKYIHTLTKWLFCQGVFVVVVLGFF